MYNELLPLFLLYKRIIAKEENASFLTGCLKRLCSTWIFGFDYFVHFAAESVGMASHPPQQCCTIGVKHEGEALGEYVDVDGGESPRNMNLIPSGSLGRSEEQGGSF